MSVFTTDQSSAMKRLFLLFLLFVLHSASAVKHSLNNVFTASSRVPNFPDTVAVVLVDGVQTAHYDSNTKTTVPTQVWMDRVTADDPEYWRKQNSFWKYQEERGRFRLEFFRRRFNQTEGLHVIQVSHGCEWDDETGSVSAFDMISFNGDDILVLDMERQRWIATKPQVLVTQYEYNNDKWWLEFMEQRLIHDCPVRLKNTLNYGKDYLQRTELPLVSLLQKTPLSPVSCHATGFYPDRAQMFWSRDGEELHEDVNHGELLQNHDGTFQISVDLNLSLVKADDWSRYKCVFQLSGVEKAIVTKLDPALIKTNWVKETSVTGLAIALSAVVALPVVMATVIYIIYRKRKGKRPPDTPDSSTEKLNPVM